MLIPREVLEIHRIASKDATRLNLTCVHAEREDADTPRLTATDGWRLLTVTWKEPEVDSPPADFGDLRRIAGFTGEIQVETCAEIARVVPKGAVGEIFRHAWLEETNPDSLTRMGAGDKAVGQAVQCETKGPDVTFPDYRVVTKDIAGAVKIGINAALLAELLQTIGKISGERGIVLHVPSDPKKPIGIHADSADGALHVDAVIMPMDIDLTGRPDWDDVPTLPDVPIIGTPKPPEPDAGADALFKGQTSSSHD